MPERSEYKHGTFSWIDLGTTDAAAAKKFYGALFGWTFDDQPAGPGMTYSMCKLGGRDAAALYTMDKAMQGVPPHWASYITVDNVDARTKKAAQSGGKVLKEAFDVMDVGRMSVIQDPTGAIVNFWQPKKHPGAGVVNEPGALTWNELFTDNVDAAGKFYVQTIGWKTEAVDMGPMGTYTLFQRAGEDKEGNAAGMMKLSPDMQGVPPHWLAYFAVADCDASAKKVGELGGKVVVPPTDIPNIGRFAIAQDPQGATFALFKMGH
jgi:predicted enzyme related to lactoylglutathione lyase